MEKDKISEMFSISIFVIFIKLFSFLKAHGIDHSNVKSSISS